MSAASSRDWGRLVMAVLWLCALALTVWVAVLWMDLRTTKSRYDDVAAHFGTGPAKEANNAAGESDKAPANEAAAQNADAPKQDENKKDGEAKQQAKQDEKKVEKKEEKKKPKK